MKLDKRETQVFELSQALCNVVNNYKEQISVAIATDALVVVLGLLVTEESLNYTGTQFGNKLGFCELFIMDTEKRLEIAMDKAREIVRIES